MNTPDIDTAERAGRALERATGDRPVPIDPFGNEQQKLADVSHLSPADFDQWLLSLSGSETLALYDHLEQLAQQHRTRANYADTVQDRLRAHHSTLASITTETERAGGTPGKLASVLNS